MTQHGLCNGRTTGETVSARWLYRVGVRGAVVAALIFGVSGTARAAEKLRIGGTGVGLAAAQALGEALQRADPAVTVEVLRSLGTPGGMRALAQGAVEVAIAARPLLHVQATSSL